MKVYKTFKFNKPINLYCFTDAHIGSKEFDKDKFEKVLKLLKKDKNGYCFFNGDNFDCTPDGYHNATNEQNLTIDEQTDEFIKIIKSLGKKVLFMRQGNHEQRVQNLTGFNLYERIGKELNIPILHIGCEKVIFEINKKRRVFVSSHGMSGSSQKVLDNMMKTHRDGDCYFVGHTHGFKNLNEGFQTFDITKNEEVLKSDVLQLAGGSFQKYADYARALNHRPTETGCYVLNINENEISIYRKLV